MGLPGLAVAQQARAAEVLLTDFPELVPLLRRNVALNELGFARHGAAASRVHARQLDWAALVDQERPVAEEAWDVVVGADIVYAEEQDPLDGALRYLCAPHTVFLLAYKERSEADADYLADRVLRRFRHRAGFEYSAEKGLAELPAFGFSGAGKAAQGVGAAPAFSAGTSAGSGARSVGAALEPARSLFQELRDACMERIAARNEDKGEKQRQPEIDYAVSLHRFYAMPSDFGNYWPRGTTSQKNGSGKARVVISEKKPGSGPA